MNDLSLVKECATAVIKNTQFCFKLEGAPAAVVLGLMALCGTGLGWYAIKENGANKKLMRTAAGPAISQDEDSIDKN